MYFTFNSNQFSGVVKRFLSLNFNPKSIKMKTQNYLIFLLLFLLSTAGFSQEGQQSVFYSNRGKNTKWFSYKSNNQALYRIITAEAFQLLDERATKISELKTKKDWQEYSKNLKSKMFASFGKFEKTPLFPKITGKITKDNYTIEKVLFESHPEFYVTGCLFIPKNRQKPAPCVIYCSGHTEIGFRSDTYQTVILNLVEKGFIVFAFDPIGQGERWQYLNTDTGKSNIGGATKEHTYAGVQTLITGTSLSDYFIWDGVRTVDYLITRKEIDPERIGITGRSGGGTQSALIAAYDERIYASAPECYITNFKRLLQSIGPQDAEQNPFNAIKLGFDHPDFLHLRAPKPSLIITTTHDFFSQQGARETFAEVKKSYTTFDKPENIQMVEDFGSHESTPGNREALYAFFQKHLENPGDNSDNEVDLYKPEELWITPTGQLQSSIKGKTVFDLNQEYFSKKEIRKDELKVKIRELSGAKFDRRTTTAVYTGKFFKNNYVVERYFLENDKNDFALPVYKIKKENSKSINELVWLHPQGKQEILNSEKLTIFLDAGFTIITADLPGVGELKDPDFSGDGFIQGVPFNYSFGAHLAGKSIPGIWAESIDLLMQHVDKENNKACAFIENEMNLSFYYYVAFENPFSKIVFLNPYNSVKKLITTEYYDPKIAYHVVPGSLTWYDVNELNSLLPQDSYKSIQFIKGVKRMEEVAFEKVMNYLAE